MKKTAPPKSKSNFLRLYTALHQINQNPVRPKDRSILFSNICQAAVEQGKFRMAWIGLTDSNTGIIQPAACAGDDLGYLSKTIITADDSMAGNGSTGKAIRDGECDICRDLKDDPRMIPWSEEAKKRGYRSSAAIPIRQNGCLTGALTLYASEPLGWHDDDITLLNRIAQDISSMLDSIDEVPEDRNEEHTRIRNSEQQFRTLLQKIQAAVIVHDADTRILSSNPIAHTLLGLTEDQLLGKTAIDPAWNFLREDGSIMPVEEYPVNRVIASKQPLRDSVVGVFRPEIKTRTWALVNADPVFAPNGTIQQVIVTFVDITDRKQTEEALHLANQYNRSLIEASLDPLVTINIDGKITDVNTATEYVTGLPRQTLIGTDFSEYFTEPDNARKGYEQVFESGCVQDYPLVIRHRDGHFIPVLYNASVYKDMSGKVAGVFAAARDISEQRKGEQATAKLAAIIESSDDAIMGKDLNGTIESWNVGAERIYGYRAEDIVGKSVSILSTDARKNEVHEILCKIKKGEFVQHIETERVRKDGVQIAVSLTVSPIKDSKGNIIGASSIARDITEQKRTDALLKQSEARLIEAQRLAHLGSWELDLAHNRLEWSAEIYRIFEIDPDQFGASYEAFLNVIHPDDREAVNSAYTTSVQNHIPYSIDHRLLFADGRIKYVHEQCKTFYDEAGSPIRSLGTVQDVTERKKIEEELRFATLYTRSLIEASLDPLVTINTEGKITDVNCATEKVTGVSRLKLIGTDFSEYFTESNKARAGYQEVFKKGFVQDFPLEIQHTNGHTTPVLYNATVYRDTSGAVIGVFAAARDIAAQKAAEKEREKYFTFFQLSTDLMCIASPDGCFKKVNPSFIQMLGFSEEELHSEPFINFVHPDDRQSTLEEIAQQLQRGYSLNFENRYRCKNGEFLWLSWMASYNKEEGLIYASARDISETKRAEHALMQANDRLESIFSNTQILFALIDANFNFIRVNRAYAEADNHDPDFFTGKNHFALYPNAENESIFRQVLASGKPYFISAKPFQYPDDPERGTTYWDWSLSPIIATDGTVVNLLFSLLNVTERKLAEMEIQKLNEELEQRVTIRTAQLEAANKELEAFAYSVSHDLRAPLRSIDGFSHILFEDYGHCLDEKGNEYLHRVRAAAQHMAELIDDMLNLSRITRSQVTMQSVNLSEIAATICEELRQSQPERRTEFTIQNDVVAHGDSHMLQIVLDNLLRNAWKFTSKNDAARIEFGKKTVHGRTVYFVRDDGAGFDMAYATKLFGAFQRLHTASEFPGTGIGLATVQRIIHKHGGAVWAEGATGHGASFYFTIP
ncbi:MAG: PAS domain S-box protein [Bacteroidota bacterium]